MFQKAKDVKPDGNEIISRMLNQPNASSMAKVFEGLTKEERDELSKTIAETQHKQRNKWNTLINKIQRGWK